MQTIWIHRLLAGLLVAASPFVLTSSARAEEHARLGLGAAVSAYSTQVQGDAEFGRQIVQLELLEETHDSGYLYPSLGAGVQWWF